MGANDMSFEETLAHYGVPGMKWGVRNDRKSSSKSKKSSGSKGSQKTDLSKLSDEELRKIVNRMQLEKQYSVLASQSKAKSDGKKAVNEVIKNAGKQEAQKLAAKGLGVAVGAAMAAVAKQSAATKANRFRGFD